MPGVAGRLTLGLAAAFAAALAAAGAFVHDRASERAEAAVAGRLAFVAFELRDALEGGLGLGLALSDIRAAQDQIDRSILDEPLIDTVAVFDAGGRIVFARDLADVGRPAAPAWRDAAAAGGDGVRTVVADGRLAAVAGLSDAIGGSAGGVAVGMDAGYVGRQALLSGTGMAAAAAGLLLAGLAAAFAALSAAARPLRREAEAAAAELDALVAAAEPAGPEAAPPPPDPDRWSAAAALADLAARERRLERLDQSA